MNLQFRNSMSVLASAAHILEIICLVKTFHVQTDFQYICPHCMCILLFSMLSNYVCLWRGLPRCASDKELTLQCRRLKRHWFNPWARKIPWRRTWQPTPVLLPGQSHGQRSLEGYSPYGGKKLKQLSVHTHVLEIPKQLTSTMELLASEFPLSTLKDALCWQGKKWEWRSEDVCSISSSATNRGTWDKSKLLDPTVYKLIN